MQLSKMELKISNTKQRTAEDFTDWLVKKISENEYFQVCLSGGSTPKIVFDELAARGMPGSEWGKVHLYWGDERCVPPDDSQSNYKMTVEHLLSKVQLPEGNIHRIKGEEDPPKEAARYSEVLKENLPNVNGVPQFDLVILGMGDDGHTASIFPHNIKLWDSDKLCVVAEHPETGQQRISITGKVINHASTVAFLVTGEGKAEKVGEIINGKGAVDRYPANLVKPVHGDLIWFLDEAAAADINS